MIMIKRRPREACRKTHDLVVGGGGAYGVALTLEAARRGLRPLLIERGDFGHATSWNTLRLIHGGLRYLQTLDWRRLRDSAAEQAWFLRHFPDLIKPLPCLMPLYGQGLRRPGAFRLALLGHALLSPRRGEANRDQRLPGGSVLSVAETIQRFPAVDPRGLRGAGLWYEGQLQNSQRLLIEMLRWAASCGADALNHVEAEDLLTVDGRVVGVRARDLATDDELEARASVVVNCAGPECRQLAQCFDRDVPELFHRSLAFNLLLARPALSAAAVAVAPRDPDGPTYFLTPWQGKILAGTYHSSVAEGEIPERVPEQRIEAFLADLNRAVPGLELRREEVLRVLWGFLPARRPGSAELAVRPVIRDHGARGGPQGLFSVSGVKLTTARLVAEKTLSLVLSRSPDLARRCSAQDDRQSSHSRPASGSHNKP